MSIERSNPEALANPPGYSHVVKDGTTVYVAGQLARDSEGKTVGEGDFAAQAEQAFKNVRTALESAGTDMNHIMKMNVFMTHREDIPDLINHYVQLITDSQHLPFRRFSTSSVNYLRNRPWPGNVRELINFIHRILLTTTSEVIEAEETRDAMGQSAAPLDAVEEKNAWRDFGQPLRSAREHFERDYLEFHLLQTRGNISELARRAELERTHLYRKLKGLGINPKDEKYRQ